MKALVALVSAMPSMAMAEPITFDIDRSSRTYIVEDDVPPCDGAKRVIERSVELSRLTLERKWLALSSPSENGSPIPILYERIYDGTRYVTAGSSSGTYRRRQLISVALVIDSVIGSHMVWTRHEFALETELCHDSWQFTLTRR